METENYPVETFDASMRKPFKIRVSYEGIFAPLPQIKNPDRKWWQFWKPTRITDPSWLNLMFKETE